MLSVLVVRIDLVEAAKVPETDPPTPFPAPLILDLQGRTLGELPDAFPSGFPGEARVAFSDWRDGFPHRIKMREINAAALGTYDLPPLAWSESQRRYVQVHSAGARPAR